MISLWSPNQLARIGMWGGLLPLLIVGGFGQAVPMKAVVLAGGVMTLIIFGAVVITKTKLQWPPFGWGMIIFLGLWLLSHFWIKLTPASINYWGLWALGTSWWVLAYTWRQEWRPDFDRLVLVVGIIFGTLLLMDFGKLLPPSFLGFGSMVVADSAYRNHFHLGDWWMLIVIFAGYRCLMGGEKRDWVLMGLGLIIMFWSKSRSAVMGLLMAFWWGGVLVEWPVASRKMRQIMVWGSILALFVLNSLKGIFLSRPYFWQAIEGFWENPRGIGMGKFYQISKDASFTLSGMNSFSFYTHNLWLEFLVGLGIVALWFWVWFMMMFWDIGKNLNVGKRMPYVLGLIALAVNFMLDTTYMIPTMVLTFMVYLGLARE